MASRLPVSCLLHRQGLGNYRVDTGEWQLTARFLQDAIRNPSPENIELAREAVAGTPRRSLAATQQLGSTRGRLRRLALITGGKPRQISQSSR